MKTINPIKSKLVVEIQVAYQCQSCQNEIVMMGNQPMVPTVCCNDGGKVFKFLWGQKISTQTTVTPYVPT